MPRDPVVYADMLAERLRRGPTQCWLVNTGWTGGPHGAGKRMRIAVTRTLLKAALQGALDDVPCGAPSGVPRPRAAEHCPGRARRACWTRGRPGRTPPPTTRAAAALAQRFAANFERFAGRVSPDVAAAGPRVAG